MAVFSDERVDLSLFSPVCLPTKSSSFEGNVGHIYGGLDTCLIVKKKTLFVGWGLTGEHSAARLEEAQVIN